MVTGFNHFIWWAAAAHLKAHGIEHHVDDVPLIRQRQIFFSDPAGNGVELNCQMDPGD